VELVHPAVGGEPAQPAEGLVAVGDHPYEVGRAERHRGDRGGAPADEEQLGEDGGDPGEGAPEPGQAQPEEHRPSGVRAGRGQRHRDGGAGQQEGGADHQRLRQQDPARADRPGEDELRPAGLLLTAQQPPGDEQRPDRGDRLHEPAGVPDDEPAHGVDGVREALHHPDGRAVLELGEGGAGGGVRVGGEVAEGLDGGEEREPERQQQGAAPDQADRQPEDGAAGGRAGGRGGTGLGFEDRHRPPCPSRRAAGPASRAAGVS
jgi:hypothetical protein